MRSSRMNVVVSAHAGSGVRTGLGAAHRVVSPGGRYARLVAQRDERAERLYAAALAENDPAQRFVSAYQAARTKAAVLVGACSVRVARSAGSATVWQQLARSVPQMAQWAQLLGAYSQRAQRAELQLPVAISPQMAADFVWAVGEFFHRVDAERDARIAAA